MQMTSESLIAGYETYATPAELAVVTEVDAPAVTPAILSFIGYSSLPCGGAVSAIGGSVVSTVVKGC